MKFSISSLFLLSSVFAGSASAAVDITPTKPIAASSRLGQSLLAEARRLEDGEEDFTWIADYSIVFQGCYSIKQWNDDFDDDSDVFVKTTNLVRFRLCPSGTCGLWCTGGYGDYVVDMSTFTKTFAQTEKRAEEYKCQMYMYKHCDCQETDDRGDDWNREYCEYDCYNDGRKYDCIDRNPYSDDEDDRKEEFEVERYAECQEFEEPEFDDDGNNNRQLANEDDNAVQYYIGPYCAAQGGKIFMGVFTDESCSVFADDTNGRSTYKSLTRGEHLPYSTKSIVNTKCHSCLEPEDPNRREEENDDAWEEEIRLAEVCEENYQAAGKCEKRMKNGPSDPNNASCQFISGIKIVREDGYIMATKPSAVVTFFIVLFAALCCALGYYVYMLRKKLGMKKDTLL